MKNLFCLIILLLLGISVTAQRTALKGKITNHENIGIKGVEIYVDMKRIKKSTNKQGKYSFKHPHKFQLLTAYSPKYGFINWQYKGEKKIDFVFPESSQPMSKADFMALGYSAPVPPTKENEKDYYANYSSILKILEHRFQEVKVKGDQILISRRGINSVLLQDPLILVNDIPTNVSTLETIPTVEVKSIRVISSGSEAAAFGYRGMNGVIIVRLKTAEDGN